MPRTTITPEINEQTCLPDESLTEGLLWRTIWQQTWPSLVATAAATVVATVDVQASGHIGVRAQAAVGLSEQILFTFNIFIIAMGVGVTAVVSREWGAGNRAQVNHAVGQALSFGLALGVTLAAAVSLCAQTLAPYFSSDAAVVRESARYLHFYGFYMVPFSIVCISNAVFRAIGKPKLGAAIVLTDLAVNVVGDYATVLGGWPIPGLGVQGIAMASVAAATIASVLCLVTIHRELSGSIQHLFPMSWAATKRLLLIGVPSVIHGLSFTTSMFAIFAILRLLPDATAMLAAWAIGVRVTAVMWIPEFALRLAVAAIVGQCLGARRPERAYQAGWRVTTVAVTISALVCLTLMIFAPQIAALFTQDSRTIALCTELLRIDALTRPFIAVGSILGGALQGAGDTKGTMWILWFTNWVVRLPLAWLLSIVFHWNARGAWIAIAISAVAACILGIIRYQRREWLRQVV